MWTWVLFSAWMICLCSLTFIFWLRPESFFAKIGKSAAAKLDGYLLVGTVLAVVFFVSCFALGVGLSVVELKGLIWE